LSRLLASLFADGEAVKRRTGQQGVVIRQCWS